jgi:hypothetical protein
VLIDQFIASHKTPPEELVLDIDASDVPLHGTQEHSEFHAYHCYLPLYVFGGQAMLACVQRRSRIDGVTQPPPSSAGAAAAPSVAPGAQHRARRLRVLSPATATPVRALGRELRINEAISMFGTRARCHSFAVDQLRLLLAALAYTLMKRLRELALKGTKLERAAAATIRVRLLKIGAAVLRNTRRARVLLASHHPLRSVFLSAAQALAPCAPSGLSPAR